MVYCNLHKEPNDWFENKERNKIYIHEKIGTFILHLDGTKHFIANSWYVDINTNNL